MIVEERLTTYLHSLESADIPVLDEIEQEALADMVPIIIFRTGDAFPCAGRNPDHG